ALARAKTKSQGVACMNNGRQLMLAWRMYTDDNNDKLPSSRAVYPDRPIWIPVTAYLDFTANPANWDINLDMVNSVLWTYAGKNKDIFKGPADRSTVQVGTQTKPRIRSISMSQVFDYGGFLNGPPYNPSQNVWRTYDRLTTIAIPPKTWVFVDEHPDSI